VLIYLWESSFKAIRFKRVMSSLENFSNPNAALHIECSCDYIKNGVVVTCNKQLLVSCL